MIRAVHLRDEAPGQAADPAVPRREQLPADRPETYLLNLQQTYGNAAVTRLVQRRPRHTAASTDAPGHSGHHGHGPSAPKTPEKKASDVHARVIKYDIDQGMGLITIASGPDQGVQIGMSGALVLANRTEYEDFTIESAEGRISRAHVRARMDQVSRDPQVVVKVSSLESQEGKEF
jgi:hypothetical protein